MRLHRRHTCIADPTFRAWWREWEVDDRGLSFLEYVLARAASMAPLIVSTPETSGAPAFVATCGHRHAWGDSCNSWSET